MKRLRQPDTHKDDGFFNGQWYVTYGILADLKSEEIDYIIADLQKHAIKY